MKPDSLHKTKVKGNMDFSEVFKKNEEWITKRLELNPDYFHKLSEGQQPECLYIGCSDSRVSAEELIGAEPGELFVHRNIANQVIVTDANINSVIQYAIDYLQVKHIIVCGHYECGGIRAALHPKDMGQINNWFQSLRDVYRLHFTELTKIKSPNKKYDRLVELNVLEQVMNLTKFYHVQRSWNKTGYPKIHGWVFDVRTGKLIDLKIDIDKEFGKYKDIYDLNYGQD